MKQEGEEAGQNGSMLPFETATTTTTTSTTSGKDEAKDPPPGRRSAGSRN